MKCEITDTPLPCWYKITEISPSDFVECCNPIYEIIEGNHESKSSEDIFMKTVLMGMYDMNEKQWCILEEARLRQKVLEMRMGYFHEELMGKFTEYYTLPNSHETGCDVMKRDGSVIIEVKNRNNTVKGSDGKHIISLLQKHKGMGKHAIFAQINCPNEKVNKYGDLKNTVDIWDGQKVYAYLSGRETFFDDLILTIQYTFATYKSLESLNTVLRSS